MPTFFRFRQNTQVKRKTKILDQISIFNVVQKRKTKKGNDNLKSEFHFKCSRKTENEYGTDLEFRFLMAWVNEKQNWEFEFRFPCHGKTVGTKVHGFLALSKVAYVANGFYSFSCKLGKFSPNRLLKSKLFFFFKNRSLFLDTFERKLGAFISLDLERKLGALISSSD